MRGFCFVLREAAADHVPRSQGWAAGSRVLPGERQTLACAHSLRLSFYRKLASQNSDFKAGRDDEVLAPSKLNKPALFSLMSVQDLVTQRGS